MCLFPFDTDACVYAVIALMDYDDECAQSIFKAALSEILLLNMHVALYRRKYEFALYAFLGQTHTQRLHKKKADIWTTKIATTLR